MEVFRGHLDSKEKFSVISLDIDDLREIARIKAIRQLGLGELSCMVLASRLRQGVMTDDRSARKLAATIYPSLPIRTTAHLVGWLVYVSELSDGDVATIVQQNKEQRGSDAIEPYIRKCYEFAQMTKLIESRQV
jgi:hypothetical protein